MVAATWQTMSAVQKHEAPPLSLNYLILTVQSCSVDSMQLTFGSLSCAVTSSRLHEETMEIKTRQIATPEIGFFELAVTESCIPIHKWTPTLALNWAVTKYLRIRTCRLKALLPNQPESRCRLVYFELGFPLFRALSSNIDECVQCGQCPRTSHHVLAPTSLLPCCHPRWQWRYMGCRPLGLVPYRAIETV